MKTKIIILGVLFALALGLMPGSALAAKKVKIVYWTVLGNVDGAIMDNIVFDKFVVENPDIDVESVQGVEDYEQKIIISTLSGTGPDITLLRSSYVASYADKDVISPITDEELAEVGVKGEDIFAPVWGFSSYKGARYTIPLDIHALALYYNRKLYSDAGLDPDSPAKTWDEYVEYAGKMTKGGPIIEGGQIGAAFYDSGPWLFVWWWFELLKQREGSLFTEDGTEVAFNSEAGKEAIKFLRAGKFEFNPTGVEWDAMRTNQIAMWLDGPWSLTYFFLDEKSEAREYLDVAPCPYLDEEHQAVWSQSHQFALLNKPKPEPEKREASLVLAKWLSDHSLDWAYAGQVPANNKVRASQGFAEAMGVVPYLRKAWVPQLPYAAFYPHNPRYLEIETSILVPSLEKIMLAPDSDIDGILAEAEQKANEIIARE